MSDPVVFDVTDYHRLNTADKERFDDWMDTQGLAEQRILSFAHVPGEAWITAELVERMNSDEEIVPPRTVRLPITSPPPLARFLPQTG